MMNQKLAQPHFWMAAALAAIVVAIQMLLSVPLAVLDEVFARALALPRLNLGQNPIVAGLINLIAFGGAIALGLYLNRLPFRNAFPLARLTMGQIAATVIMILGGDVLLSEADNLVRSVAPPPQFLLEAFRQIFSAEGNLVARIFLLVIVAPVTEELLFRGIILRGLLSRHRPAVAVLLTAFLFAAVHMNPWQFVSAFWLGVAFGWFYLRTGSVNICILAHAISNGLFVFFTSIPIEIPGLTGEPEFSHVVFQPWWLDFAGVVLLAAGILVFRKSTPPRLAGNEEQPGFNAEGRMQNEEA